MNPPGGGTIVRIGGERMIRVLIAEDEPAHPAERTKRLIERIDADFIVASTAGDGEEALEKMRAEHFRRAVYGHPHARDGRTCA